MIKEYNFDEFDQVSKALWMDKLNQDLGADVAQRILSWKCERELTLAAYYDQGDSVDNKRIKVQSKCDWKYLQPLQPNSTNKQILDALMNGAEGLILTDDQVPVLDKTLDQVAPEHCTLVLNTSDWSNYEKFTNWWKGKQSAAGEVLVFHDIKHISSAITADHMSFLEKTFQKGSEIGHRIIHIDGGVIQKNGGSTSLELTYILSQTVFYINFLIDQGYEIDKVAKSLFVSTTIGSSFFLELSKIRAIRLLLTQVLQQYGLSNIEIPIHASTSPITKSALDSNTNFLRCTSEAISAVLGGVDYLSITPYHDLTAGDRIARNISNLLKDESYMSKVADPAAGSYYIENVSSELIEDAWNRFQQIEINGGFEQAVSDKIFHKEVAKDLNFQKERIASGRRKVVGINDFGNPDEKISIDQLGHEYLSLSSDFEAIRKGVESYVLVQAERPVVYLLAVGKNAKMINARYSFVTNFFNWAGLEVVKVDQLNEFKKMHILVCCGADEDYNDSNIEYALNGLESSSMVLAAGKQDIANTNKISGWIHAKSNRLEMVKNILTQMGVIQKQSES